jgi:uncharacterized protein
MDVTPLIPNGRKIIQSYSNGGFKISGISYSSGVIVFPTMVETWIPPKDVHSLSLNDFSFVLEHSNECDVILLGCGTNGAFLNPSLRNEIKNKGLTIDAMNTGAACRTYNVLMAEGRRVAAMLMPIKVI